jgi:uncharacterized protein YkuJ
MFPLKYTMQNTMQVLSVAYFHENNDVFEFEVVYQVYLKYHVLPSRCRQYFYA